MEDKIAAHVRDIPRSGIRDFFEIVQSMHDVISLGIGEPDFVTPWHIREAALFSLEKGRTGYTSNLGLPKLREAIAGYVSRQFHVDYHAPSEVLVSVGVSEAIDIALRALINPGDEVLFHEPCYVSYGPSITLAHGKAVSIPVHGKDNFQLRAEEMAKRRKPKCSYSISRPTRPARPCRVKHLSRSPPSARSMTSSSSRTKSTLN